MAHEAAIRVHLLLWRDYRMGDQHGCDIGGSAVVMDDEALKRSEQLYDLLHEIELCLGSDPAKKLDQMLARQAEMLEEIATLNKQGTTIG